MSQDGGGLSPSSSGAFSRRSSLARSHAGKQVRLRDAHGMTHLLTTGLPALLTSTVMQTVMLVGLALVETLVSQ